MPFQYLPRLGPCTPHPCPPCTLLAGYGTPRDLHWSASSMPVCRVPRRHKAKGVQQTRPTSQNPSSAPASVGRNFLLPPDTFASALWTPVGTFMLISLPTGGSNAHFHLRPGSCCGVYQSRLYLSIFFADASRASCTAQSTHLDQQSADFPIPGTQTEGTGPLIVCMSATYALPGTNVCKFVSNLFRLQPGL